MEEGVSGMTGLNVCVIWSPGRDKILMCLRRKEPYKGKFNMPGGHIEDGEDHLAAAYRELYEETAVTRDDVELTHFMDFTYHLHGMLIEVYFGILRHEVEVHGEENDLYWLPLTENFFDYDRFAGDGNIGHIMRLLKARYPETKTEETE